MSFRRRWLGVLSFVMLCATSLSAQVAREVLPSQGITDLLLQQVERLTLVGALSIGVMTLWRENRRKDVQVEAMVKAVTDYSSNFEELRKAIEKLVDRLQS
jgi:hypothetical protein